MSAVMSLAPHEGGTRATPPPPLLLPVLLLVLLDGAGGCISSGASTHRPVTGHSPSPSGPGAIITGLCLRSDAPFLTLRCKETFDVSSQEIIDRFVGWFVTTTVWTPCYVNEIREVTRGRT